MALCDGGRRAGGGRWKGPRLVGSDVGRGMRCAIKLMLKYGREATRMLADAQ